MVRILLSAPVGGDQQPADLGHVTEQLNISIRVPTWFVTHRRSTQELTLQHEGHAEKCLQLLMTGRDSTSTGIMGRIVADDGRFRSHDGAVESLEVVEVEVADDVLAGVVGLVDVDDGV